jgi:hypothetical protein
MRRAAQRGHTAVCQFLRAEGCPWSAGVCQDAARAGHCDTLRWLHERGCPWEAERVCTAAAEGGCIAVLQYLLQTLLMLAPPVLTVMLNAAGANNQLAAAQWLRQRGAQWPDALQYQGRSWSRALVLWAKAECCNV